MTESDKELNFRKLEESRDAALEDVGKLKASLSRAVAQLAGFDPDKKVTQMVINEFLNDDDLELDSIKADDFKSFATDAGLDPVVTEEETTSEETNEVTEEEQVISQMQERADELEDKTSTKEVEGPQEKLIQAHENHDPDAAIAAGMAMMDQMQDAR